MNATDHADGYPDFVTEADRHAWDQLTSENKQKYFDAIPYIQREYPEEELSVALIGTVLAFGG